MRGSIVPVGVVAVVALGVLGPLACDRAAPPAPGATGSPPSAAPSPAAPPGSGPLSASLPSPAAPPGSGPLSASLPSPASAPSSGPSAPGAAVASVQIGAPAPSTSSSTPEPCPPEMALVGKGTCVDRWEAHLVSRAEDGSFSPHPHFERPEPGVDYVARSEPGVFPQGYVSRVESATYCKAAGKRLCTLGEWSRACRGKRWSTFPWGNGAARDACNVAKIHLLSKLFGENGRAWKYDEHFNSPRLNQEPGFLERTGERARCAGDDGVFDMVGNLHEWVSDAVTDDLVERLEKEPYERKKQPWHEGNGIFMGGFFSTLKEHGPGCTFITIAHEPRYHDYSTGFRCCKAADVPPPPPRRKRP